MSKIANFINTSDLFGSSEMDNEWTEWDTNLSELAELGGSGKRAAMAICRDLALIFRILAPPVVVMATLQLTIQRGGKTSP